MRLTRFPLVEIEIIIALERLEFNLFINIFYFLFEYIYVDPLHTGWSSLMRSNFHSHKLV